ncbi:MAG: carbohydrate diacid regulator [Caldanaerobacter sp.]|nr:carbohydrate diacid regulator [Caldanaerobacter sp.]MDK2793661.1 carbohydrate diacid regulator [Caldanaerobacter sp.]
MMVDYNLLRKIGEDIKKHLDVPLYIFDTEGNLIYGKEDFFEKKAGFLDLMVEYIEERDVYYIGEFTCYNIFYDNNPVFVIALKGKTEEEKKLILAISLIFRYFDENLSKEDYLINVLENRLPLSLISYYAHRYKIDNTVSYNVAIVEVENEIEDAVKIVLNIFERKAVHVIKIGKKRFAVIFPSRYRENLVQLFKTMKDMIESEGYLKNVKIAGSFSSFPLEKLHVAYKEAEKALFFGEKLEGERGIYLYQDYIYSEILWGMDKEKAEEFLERVNIGEDLLKDEELMQTLNAFFRNNLNLSETSRDLYIHRNTLVYRLDKILKMSGLDARKFDEALLLKLAITLAKLYDISR